MELTKYLEIQIGFVRVHVLECLLTDLPQATKYEPEIDLP